MNFTTSAQRRSARMAVPDGAQLIGDKAYNLIIGAVVLFGLAVNALLCRVCGNAVMYINPIILILGYLVCVIAGTMITYRSDVPVISFLGYCLVVVPVGVVVSSVVYCYGGIDAPIVLHAFMLTAGITLVMTVLAISFPWFFSGIGQFLLSVLIGLVVCELVCLLFGIHQYATSLIAAGIFSLYIGYDVYRSQMFPKTVDHAIDCALDIYLDIINLFLRILSLLGRGGNSSSGSGRH